MLAIYMAQRDNRAMLEIATGGALELRDVRALLELTRDLRQRMAARERVVLLGRALRTRKASRGRSDDIRFRCPSVLSAGLSRVA